MMQPEKFDELISASEQINPGKRVHRLALLNVAIYIYIIYNIYILKITLSPIILEMENGYI